MYRWHIDDRFRGFRPGMTSTQLLAGDELVIDPPHNVFFFRRPDRIARVFGVEVRRRPGELFLTNGKEQGVKEFSPVPGMDIRNILGLQGDPLGIVRARLPRLLEDSGLEWRRVDERLDLSLPIDIVVRPVGGRLLYKAF